MKRLHPIMAVLLVPALFSCATHSNPTPLPPSLCTTVRHVEPMPAGAGIVQPVTPEEKDATRLFLSWVAESLGIADENAAKAETARKAC